jgi:two-component system cell cycle sensor histidine kinase/response regulator CckA
VSELDDLRRDNARLRRTLTEGGQAAPDMAEFAQSELSRSERLMRQVFNAAVDAMMLVDETGRFVDVNAAACALYGVTRARLLRTGSLDFASDPESWREFLTAGERRGELTVARSDGEARHVDYVITARAAADLHLALFRDVTESRKVDLALRRSEQRLRTVVANAPIVLFAVDIEGVFTFCEGRALTEGDRTARSLVGTSVFEHAPRASQAQMHVRKVLDGHPVQWRGVEGSKVFETSMLPLRSDDGRMEGAIGVSLDVTERDRAEAALRDSEARFRAMIEKSAEGICLVGADGRLAYASPRALELVGVGAVGLTDESAFGWVHADDRARVNDALAELEVASGNSVAFECRALGSRVPTRWVEVTATNLLDDRAVQAITVNIRDVSERRSADDALRASEYRYRRIIETTSDGVWMLDEDGMTTFASARLCSMLSCAAHELRSRSLMSLVADEYRSAMETAMAGWRRGVAGRYEARLSCHDGAAIIASLQTNPLFDEQGRYEGALAVVTDVTEHRHGEAERARLASIVESSHDAIYSIDRDCTVLAWNRAAETLYGYAASEIIGRSLELLVPPDRLFEVEERRVDMTDRRTRGQLDTVRRRKEGSEVEVALTISPMANAAGEVIGCSMIARDLTERRRAEAALHRSEVELRQAQKLEAVGRLAGGVAHDFNNLLSVVLSYAELALEDLDRESSVRDDVEEIRKAAKRAVNLTQQLLAFSRQQVLLARVLDLNEVVASMDKMLRLVVGERTAFVIAPCAELHHVKADPGQIEQIIMNLVINARDAMPGGGTVEVRTDNAWVDEALAASHRGVRPGAHARLSVIDTGEGMDAATLSRIFDPFFTTKEKGKGTGLGLSTVFGIVQQSGGAVVVDSEPGRGTRFDIYLPRADGPLSAGDNVLPLRVEGQASETILLVEDEEQVRVLARTILRKQGYKVLEAPGASEALAASEKYGAPIHLLLTDMVMPVMSGRQLAERIAIGRPGLRVLYMSGYTDDAVFHDGVRDAEIAFLQKPFTPFLLAEKVRRVLDHGTEAVHA